MTTMTTKRMMIMMMTLGPLAVVPIDADRRLCNPGWKYYAAHRLCVFRTSIVLSEKDAPSKCRANGSGMENSQVLVIADRNLSLWVSEIFSDENMVINLKRTKFNTEWKYLNGTKFTGYTNWAEGEPNDPIKRDSCVHIWAGTGGKWADTVCWKKMKYLCQAEAWDFCNSNATICDQICTTQENGWVVCSCMEDYELNGNGSCLSITQKDGSSFSTGWIVLVIVVALAINGIIYLVRNKWRGEDDNLGAGPEKGGPIQGESQLGDLDEYGYESEDEDEGDPEGEYWDDEEDMEDEYWEDED